MVFLADLDQEPYSRKRGLMIGVAIAIPIALLFAAFVLPRLRAAIVNAAADHDARAEARNVYMNRVCSEALVVERDEKMCGCVLGSEYPSIDCISHFNVWATNRQVERCADPATFDAAVSFCTCVQTLEQKSAELADPKAARVLKSEGYPRCVGLEDRLDFPPLEQLASTFAPE